MAISLKDQFVLFSKFGDTKSDGTTITLTQSDKWMKQANVFDGKKVTTIDTGICFNKFKSKTLNFDKYVSYLGELAKDKNINLDQLKQMMSECGQPGLSGATAADKANVVDRLTDTKGYTGAHKQRFDESGKGRGLQGREDVHENTGYVQGFKGGQKE